MLGWTRDREPVVPPGGTGPDPARGADAGRRPAARRRPPGRAAAGAGRPRHRQDHDPGRGDRRPHRGARRRPRVGAGADLQPQGRRAAPRPGDRAARAHAVQPDQLDLPLLRLRSGPPLLARRPLPRAAPAAVGARAGRRDPGPADRSRRRSPGPTRCKAAVRTRGFAAEVQAVLSRAREKGLDPVDLAAARPRVGRGGVRRRGRLHAALPRGSRRPQRGRLRRPDPARGRHRRGAPRRAAGAATGTSSSTSTRTPTPARWRCCRRSAGDGRDLVVVGDPDQSIYGFRGADVNGILRFPTSFPRTDAAPAPVVALRTTRRFGSRLLTASQAVAASIGSRGDIRARRLGGVPLADRRHRPTSATAGSTWPPSTPRAPRPSTSPTCCAGRTSRTAWHGPRWRCWCARAAPRCPRCAGPCPPPAYRSRSPATRPRWSASPR